MLFVDTNVVAYLLIEGKHTAAAQQLHRRDSDWRSEAFLVIEFTNVLASSITTKRMTLSLATALLAKVTALFDGKLGRIPHSPWRINSGAALSPKTPDCAPPRPP